jgi:pyruvate/2-oxoglutarate/acetoin dehydrogenase E1 component/TPP-dependent pyruvate/acetoin dehydrogenase alpha subunit
VGTSAVCRPGDYWISAYREHGHALAKGVSANAVMAELFGKATGCTGGKGGSMHLFSVEHNFYGGHAIVGIHLPHAAGMAHAIKQRGEDGVVVCFFGEGAVNNGAFHEALNLADLWQLPVVFLCENNRYAMGTPLERGSSIYDLSLKGRAYDMECDWLDGMDVIRVMEKVGEAVDRARAESRPTFLEARTYRFRGHSMADPAHYRTKEEVQEQRKRDPILLLENRLRADGELSKEQIKSIEEEVEKVVDEAAAFADEPSPMRAKSRPTRSFTPTYTSERRSKGIKGAPTMAVMTYREALNQALREEMNRDENVFLIGEEVGFYQGAFKVSQGLLEEFGEKRVMDTPIAEGGFTGFGVGAAMLGMRPIVEMMTFNFALQAIDQIVNAAAKMHYMSAGQITMPIVVRGPGGAAHQLAATHSQCFENYFCYVPGLKVVMPSTPKDVKGLLKSAVRDENPVIMIEGELLYGLKGEVPEEDYLVPIGQAEVKKEGKDATVIAHSKMLHHALRAAEILEKDKLDIEVVDPRTLRPLDVDTLSASLRKTNRAVIVEEGWLFCGVGAQIAASLYEAAFDHLDAPIKRVTQADVPIPYNRRLEKLSLPDPEAIVEAVREVCYL